MVDAFQHSLSDSTAKLLHELGVLLCVQRFGEDISKVEGGFNILNIELVIQEAFSDVMVVYIDVLRAL